ncbi:hypothetical protein B0I35DRAFT_348511 [Stachybotrys elegans]|uniref:G domain-containing protein n=1 Tax=Stachybotrys elegans TaxID=80388 RepID=A0A8K0SYJ5_9HYPO|nr:hypothetical protein B0I35DRAFT_348511 [Stachybotrys elegans]
MARAINDVSKDIQAHNRSLLTPEPADKVAMGSPSPRNRRRTRSNSPLPELTHDVREEKPPNDRFHDANFQRAFAEAKGVMATITSTLGSGRLHDELDSTMARLHERANQLATFECSPTRTVGFVGDSGVGKSSLLNSLLDMKGLARTSNSGSACTCVVTEYHYRDSTDFTVEVNYFTAAELLEQVQDLLQFYETYHLHNDRFTSAEQEDREVCKEKAAVASDTFSSMFGSHFNHERMLQHLRDGQAKEVVRGLIDKCRPGRENPCQVRKDLKACSDLIAQLTSETSGQSSKNRPAAWPYIRNIKVYTNAHILSKGLILVDLPGLRDVNSARRHITERYLIKCDEVFAICNEGRAITDVGVVSVLDLAKKAQLSDVGIICTRSDDIQPEEARRDWQGDKAIQVQAKIESIRATKETIRCLKEEQENILDYDDRTVEENELLVNIGREMVTAELTQCLVTTRNDIVKRELMEKYRTQVTKGQLHVHCVSNKMYWEHREKPKGKAMPYLNLCGILAIREHCMALVSESRYSAALNYMKNDISSFLSDAALWVRSGSGSMTAERKTKIRDALDAVERRLKRALTGNSSRVSNAARMAKSEFKDTISTSSYTRFNSWSKNAQNANMEWRSVSQFLSNSNHPYYAAFCRNRGNHYTAKIGSRDWNSEIIQLMVEDAEPLWSQLCSTLASEQEDLVGHILELIESEVDFLETELGDEEDVVEVLGQALLYRQRLIEADVEGALEAFMKDLNSLRIDAFSSIPTSFIGVEMEDAYRKAGAEYGDGSDQRRKHAISSAVNRNELFKDLHQALKKGFISRADSFQQTLSDVAQAHLESVRLTLNMVRDENVILESEKDPQFRDRVEAGVRAAKVEIAGILTSVSA